MSVQETLDYLDSDATRGLSETEVRLRRETAGPNELSGQSDRSIWSIFLEQIRSPMVLILIAACSISLLLGEIPDTVAILAIILINAVLGVREEYKAEKAIASLKQLSDPRVKTTRNGMIGEVGSRDLVTGDIIHLEAGDMVPADSRLIFCKSLRIQESSLTGESEPVEKQTGQLEEAGEVPLGDRVNMAYMGTPVVHGRGIGVVAATGMETELGRVARMLQAQEEEPSPLQRRLRRLARRLAFAAVFLVLIVVLTGLSRGEAAGPLLLTAVSLAVAAMPEGLPAVVTIVLALGAERMLRHRALVRRLPAVESLGSVTVICTDKTGTLTENTMTVTILDAARRRIDLTQELKKSGPRLTSGETLIKLSDYPAMALLLLGGALCNNAVLKERPVGRVSASGDPSEGALVIAAARTGMRKERLEEVMPRIGEVPFDSERRLMTTVHVLKEGSLEKQGDLFRKVFGEGEQLVFTKGALDSLMPLCDRIAGRNEVSPMSDNDRKRIQKDHDELAGMGMRILGVGCRSHNTSSAAEIDGRMERNLVYVGMVGMLDPPRANALEAVRTCKEAGIRPVMITGDHPLTAAHIARELGIGQDSRVLTGARIEDLDESGLIEEVDHVDVYARVSPADKLRIVKALQARGHIVAMTGDGVNDAPALKKADVGVSMGKTGTEVAKEASDIILQDDNFATIVHAVKEGRTIFDNIRKFILFILASNSAEILVMLAGPMLGMPLPLYPLQILWINLLSDGLPAVALAVEQGEPDLMERAPVDPDAGIFTRGMVIKIVWVGTLLGLFSLGLGHRSWGLGDPAWRTLVFTTLTFGQMANVLAIRTGKQSLFRAGITSNLPLLGAVFLTCGLQLIVVFAPPLQSLFKTTTLTAGQLAECLFFSSLVFWAVELEKLIRRHTEKTAGNMV